jgi:MoxR-like ATPase
VALLAGGHLLIEGVPGLAKTLTVKTVAQTIGGSFGRVQFTPDLVPADLVGTRIFRPGRATFDVELGPVFCNLLLADEINRAPAKVQSALLEVMQERQVTIGTQTHAVPDPFLVMATENPIESEGTYPLPEAQLDRFLLKIIVDYPPYDDEVRVVERSLAAIADVERVLTPARLRVLQRAVEEVYVDPAVIAYAVTLATVTRDLAAYGIDQHASHVSFGASPRAAISLVHSARALALLRGRDYVRPVDARDLAKDAYRHRLVVSYDALMGDVDADMILDAVLDRVPLPHIELGEATA